MDKDRQFLNDFNPIFIWLVIIVVISAIVYIFYPRQDAQVIETLWEKGINGLGMSSPISFDIDQDGIKDIVVGTGFSWSTSGNSSMEAINGMNGAPIWTTEMPGGVLGSSIILDINGDGTNDVSVSGAFADFFMLNGLNGDKLWSLTEQNPTVKLLPCKFNSPILIQDQDGDNIQDIVVIQGGLLNKSSYISIFHHASNQYIATAYDEQEIEKKFTEILEIDKSKTVHLTVCKQNECKQKYFNRNIFLDFPFEIYMNQLFENQVGPGSRVYIISSVTGKIIRIFLVPFDSESQSVPSYFSYKNMKWIIYGSGNQWKSGHVIAQNIQNGNVMWTIETKNKGVLSSPTLYKDFNLNPFVMVSTLNGDVMKINAQTGAIVWNQSIGSEYEGFIPIVGGKFKGTAAFDFAAIFSRGTWPKYESSSVFLLDGETGDVINKTMIGNCFAAASPLVADINNDKKEDIILLSCTDYDVRLIAYDHSLNYIFKHRLASGGVSTPLIDDIDGNGQIDIIVSRFHFMDRYKVLKPYSAPLSMRWGNYRGPQMNGNLN